MSVSTEDHVLQASSRRRPRVTQAFDRGLILLILAFVATATAYNVFIPPYENLDELEHAEVIRHIAVTGRLPVHDEAENAGFHVRQEASQPPLYHILAAGLSRLLGLSTQPHRPTAVAGDVVACGATGAFYNRATWVHDPYGVISDRKPAEMTLRVLRGFSTSLQVATLVGVWTLARRVFPSGPVPLLATAAVVFNPQLLLLAAGVNNDNAVIPLATWGLVLGFDLWDRDLSWPRTLAFGLVGGLAALSKLSGAAILGIGALALVARLVRGRSPLAGVVAHGLVLCALAAVVVAPWVTRNITLYGDPTALAPMLAKVGRRSAPISLGEARPMALSYWGQLPCAFYPKALYWPFMVLTVGGVVGLLVGWRNLTGRRRAMVAMCAVWFAVIVAAWIRWDTMTAATGGRLLFPAIAALGLALGIGWSRWGRQWVRCCAAILPAWAIIVLVIGPGRMMAPPRIVAALDAGTSQAGVAFGDRLVLQDYGARIRATPGRCLLSSNAYCGPSLDLRLEWLALDSIDESFTLVVQLVSALPGATDLRLNYNHWPGRGNLPTSRWPSGVTIKDRYLLPLPAAAGETQAWHVTVAYVDADSGERLPVSTGGVGLGDNLILGTVRVSDQQPDPDRVEALPAPVVYSTGDSEDAIQLEGAQVRQHDDANWTVDLLWRCSRRVTIDAVTFIHGYDANGALLAGGDGPPKQGAFPTSLWEPGDLVLSRHTLSFDLNTRPHTIAVGLYLAADGTRLPATVGGGRLPDDAYVVWNGEP